MGIRAVFAEALPDIFNEAGEDARFVPLSGNAKDCKIFIEFDVLLQPSGVEAQATEVGTTIEALLSDETLPVGDTTSLTQEPVRGDTFVYDGTTYTVKAIISNDKMTIKMVVT